MGEESKGYIPLGIDEDYYKVSTTSTIPIYETPHLGLTQYTPNRITSWLNNYNEDMRKIDKNSSSIASGIIKILDDSAAEHKRLQDEIDNTNSVMAFNEKRIDNVEDAILDLRGDIADARLYTDQEVARSEVEMTKKLNAAMAATASSIAYVQHEVDRNNFVTSTSIARMEQRLHVAEDELIDIRQDMGAETADVAALKNDMSLVKARLTDAEDDIADTMADVADLQTANTALGGRVASLEATEVVQNSTINSLNNQVASMQNIGDDVNELKTKDNIKKMVSFTGAGAPIRIKADAMNDPIQIDWETSPLAINGASILQTDTSTIIIDHMDAAFAQRPGADSFEIEIMLMAPESGGKYIEPLFPSVGGALSIYLNAGTGNPTDVTTKLYITIRTNASGFAAPIPIDVSEGPFTNVNIIVRGAGYRV